MRDRFYTLLFVILPKRWQTKLWNHLANKAGYHGLTKFGNNAFHFAGTKLTKDDYYADLRRWFEERRNADRPNPVD